MSEALLGLEEVEAELVEGNGARPDWAPSKLFIVGFAPSWNETPWSVPGAHYWGLNNLHKVAPDRPWSAWFQLHDIGKHHAHDAEEHLQWLRTCGIPVYMFAEHMSYDIPTAVPYPREAVVEHFGHYFTNSVSWMLALAIMSGQFPEIGIYGIDMAQDEEYQHQRPSVEFFLGWARGKGIDIDIPATADLLKAPFLYGIDEGADQFMAKLDARIADLTQRQNEVQAAMNNLQGQLNQHNEIRNQIIGALEDCHYWRRTYVNPSPQGGSA